jgi:ribonuclease I
MKQTAVEWLENQIKNSKYYFKLMAEINSRSTIAQPNVFEQAKEMEKEQIKEAFAMGNDDIGSEQYYNETYK